MLSLFSYFSGDQRECLKYQAGLEKHSSASSPLTVDGSIWPVELHTRVEVLACTVVYSVFCFLMSFANYCYCLIYSFEIALSVSHLFILVLVML